MIEDCCLRDHEPKQPIMASVRKSFPYESGWNGLYKFRADLFVALEGGSNWILAPATMGTGRTWVLHFVQLENTQTHLKNRCFTAAPRTLFNDARVHLKM